MFLLSQNQLYMYSHTLRVEWGFGTTITRMILNSNKNRKAEIQGSRLTFCLPRDVFVANNVFWHVLYVLFVLCKYFHYEIAVENLICLIQLGVGMKYYSIVQTIRSFACMTVLVILVMQWNFPIELVPESPSTYLHPFAMAVTKKYCITNYFDVMEKNIVYCSITCHKNYSLRNKRTWKNKQHSGYQFLIYFLLARIQRDAGNSFKIYEMIREKLHIKCFQFHLRVVFGCRSGTESFITRFLDRANRSSCGTANVSSWRQANLNWNVFWWKDLTLRCL